MNAETRTEKLFLLAIAMATVIALTIIALAAIYKQIDSNGATLVGVVVGGLGAFSKDIVAAVRSYSMADSLRKVTDQLAASAPAAEPAPQDAVEGAKAVADAATEKADQVAGA